jgi:hypothetical protein
MTRFGLIRGMLLAMSSLLLCVWAAFAYAQTTQITTEYLATAEASFDPPIRIDNSTSIVPGRPGGWIKGPRINAKIVFSGDWLRVMPSGTWRLDVRGLIQTDDNAFIYASFNGIVQHSKESYERWRKGEVLSSKDVPYFVIAPTFQTSSAKYAWLNSVQVVGKMVEFKGGEGEVGSVRYDLFIVR